MQKLAMRLEGTRRKHVQKWNTYEDMELYGILKEEWEQSANKWLQRTFSNGVIVLKRL
jgi:hypothetical protein